MVATTEAVSNYGGPHNITDGQLIGKTAAAHLDIFQAISESRSLLLHGPKKN